MRAHIAAKGENCVAHAALRRQVVKSPLRLLLHRGSGAVLLLPARYICTYTRCGRSSHRSSSVDSLPPGGYPTQRALEYPADMLANAQPPFWFQPQNSVVPQADTVYADGRPGQSEPDLHQCASPCGFSPQCSVYRRVALRAPLALPYWRSTHRCPAHISGVTAFYDLYTPGKNRRYGALLVLRANVHCAR